jgi:hypothetical protein
VSPRAATPRCVKLTQSSWTTLTSTARVVLGMYSTVQRLNTPGWVWSLAKKLKSRCNQGRFLAAVCLS